MNSLEGFIMDTILCFMSKCFVGIAFAITWCLYQLVQAGIWIGKCVVAEGTNLSNEIAIMLSQMQKDLVKDCPPFRWPVIPAAVIALFSTLLFVFMLGWLFMQTTHEPSAPLDLGWLSWVLMLLLVLVIVVGLIYALRHIIPWIAGILAILGLISVLASAPSCSGPSVSIDTSEETKATEYCWFYEACFWKDTSTHWSMFNFPSYCWFWEECYSRDSQGSSGSSTPTSNKADHQDAKYCWFWESCFWYKDDLVVLKPAVIQPPTKSKEAKVSALAPEATEYVIKKGDTLWKLTNGDMKQIDVLAYLNAGVLDPYWVRHCHLPAKKNKWCAEPKHTLQIGMRIFIPTAK